MAQTNARADQTHQMGSSGQIKYTARLKQGNSPLLVGEHVLPCSTIAVDVQQPLLLLILRPRSPTMSRAAQASGWGSLVTRCTLTCARTTTSRCQSHLCFTALSTRRTGCSSRYDNASQCELRIISLLLCIHRAARCRARNDNARQYSLTETHRAPQTYTGKLPEAAGPEKVGKMIDSSKNPPGKY